MKTRTIFGPYEPDKPSHLQDGLTDMANAYPGANGYRPVGQFQQITPALPGLFRGADAYVASDMSGVLIGGTSTGLYRGSVGAWSTLATGLSGPFPWRFTQFGDLAIAVNGGPTKKIDLIANTVADVPGAPTAACAATVRDFVVYGQADGNAAMVQWSGFNNQDDNTPGVNQAGFQPMLTGGAVQGIAGGEYGVIVQRSRIVRMTYTGEPDTPFQFDEIVSNLGAISRGSIALSGKMVFFLSDKGFMQFDGSAVTPIGFEKVDATLFKTYPRPTLDQMQAAIDPRRNIVAWMMPGSPGAVFIYNWALERWGVLRFPISGILSGFTANLTLEDLDGLYPGGLEAIPYPLDDTRFSGGDPLFIVVRPDNTFGTLSGDNMAAWFETPFMEHSPGRTSRFRSVRPLIDATDGLTITIDARARLGDVGRSSSRSILTRAGDMPVRANGRYVATRLDIAEGIDWSYAQGLEFEAEPGHRR